MSQDLVNADSSNASSNWYDINREDRDVSAIPLSLSVLVDASLVIVSFSSSFHSKT